MQEPASKPTKNSLGPSAVRVSGSERLITHVGRGLLTLNVFVHVLLEKLHVLDILFPSVDTVAQTWRQGNIKLCTGTALHPPKRRLN